MTAPWTPGPWAADAISMDTGDIRINCVGMPLVLASVHNGASMAETLFGGAPKTQWANARLIAAAPEMAEALMRIADGHDMSNTHMRSIARMALAKAGTR